MKTWEEISESWANGNRTDCLDAIDGMSKLEVLGLVSESAGHPHASKLLEEIAGRSISHIKMRNQERKLAKGK